MWPRLLLVTKPYTAPKPLSSYFPPVIDDTSLVSGTGATLDASTKAGTSVTVTGGIGTMTIIAGRYVTDPQVSVAFSAGAVAGGMGRPAIKYVGVCVQGTTTGTVRVTVSYADAEAQAYDKSSLYLAYFSVGSWRKADNITVDTANHTVSGDIPVVRATGTAIGLSGLAATSTTTQVTSSNVIPGGPVNTGGGGGGEGIPWILFGVVGVTILIVAIVILIVESKRRRTAAQYAEQPVEDEYGPK